MSTIPEPRPGQPGPLAAAAVTARSVVEPLALQADRDRQLASKAVEALTDAGFSRHFVPRRFGGSAGTFSDFVAATTEVSQGCAAAGWCASLFASHARLAAYLPAEGQQAVWREGPDARISAGFVPNGEARSVSGGWRLSGSWNFISGVDFAHWVLLTAWEPGIAEKRLRFFAVPRRDCAVEDTWFTVGLRGTGSRTVILDDVFVPVARTFSQAVLLAGTAPETEPVGCHGVPLRLVNGLTMLTPAFGSALGALSAWTGWIGRKTEVLMGRTVQAAEKPSVQSVLARASFAIDAAGLLLGRIAAQADAGAGPQTVPRNHRDFALIAETLTEAVDRLQHGSGARGQLEGSAVERAWRDVHAAASHAALEFDSNVGVYARSVLATAGPTTKEEPSHG
ncbi:acyl-CoA dehydrogenase family protein [Kitasatospora sp. NBC_01250]|uniref:acyl-CoA dehydrogenase family protein n=1 Tax=Kitasatospora sp. NBC_01250 TaxID=2903571 RepID=UPI002E36D47C|nr:acyl-CoA dehydrogenase family protein [Kitasatospora sp. NBC_01250]